jgi:plasmid maintenance system killer protein
VPSDQRWQPTASDERYVALDVLRGLALFGVLLINLHTLFRVSLFEHILHFHTEPGTWNHVADVLLAGLLETKAVSLFSLMFGIGSAIQAERAAARGVNVTRFLVRRYLVLLALGLCHWCLIWNGDILTLYAVCGLLIVPFMRLPAWMLAVLGGKAARRIPRELWPVVHRKLTMLDSAKRLEDLAAVPGNRFEALAGDREGQHSIRVNQQYRLTFRWETNDAYDVCCEDYH